MNMIQWSISILVFQLGLLAQASPVVLAVCEPSDKLENPSDYKSLVFIEDVSFLIGWKGMVAVKKDGSSQTYGTSLELLKTEVLMLDEKTSLGSDLNRDFETVAIDNSQLTMSLATERGVIQIPLICK